MATILAIILSNDKIEEFIQYFGIDASEYVICHAITTVYLSDEERKIGFLFLLEKLFVVKYIRCMQDIYALHVGYICPTCWRYIPNMFIVNNVRQDLLD